MSLKETYLLLLLVLSCFCVSNAQKASDRGDYRIVFYNVENLFDTQNDSLTQDDDFTPKGLMHWNFSKYRKKIHRIAQVIMGVGGWEVPELVGLCEVENDYVLKGLTQHTPLAKFHYDFIHFDSPDKRGVDVALLYLKERFTVHKKERISVDLSSLGEHTTRDILYVEGSTSTNDTLHLFVNHWPSKYRGALETIPERKIAARTVRKKIDSLLREDALAKIIIMGDFNAVATSASIREELDAKVNWDTADTTGLYNLSARWNAMLNYGSYKRAGIWSSIDLFVVSLGILKGKGSLFASEKDAHVYRASFLMEEDKEGGLKPFRTNNRMKYNDGFSDHLPIYLDLWRK